MNPVQAALPPTQLIPKGSWLLALAVIYGLVFFPGALFYRPLAFEQETFIQATELFLMFPKLLVFGVLVLLGFLEQRSQVQWRHPLVWLTGLHLLLVVVSSLNSGDELTYTLLGARGRFDGLLYQVADRGCVHRVTATQIFARAAAYNAGDWRGVASRDRDWAVHRF